MLNTKDKKIDVQFCDRKSTTFEGIVNLFGTVIVGVTLAELNGF